MKTIAFFNVKGGVGKTSSTINIALALSQIFEKKVLVIDLDAQANTTDYFDRYDNPYTTENVLTGTGQDGEKITIKEAITKTAYERIDIVSSRLSLGRCEKALVADITVPQQFRLTGQLKAIQNDYDFCLLDLSPAAESLVNTNGIACADAVYVPLKCDNWAIRGLDATLAVIDTISSYNANLTFGGCFFVQWENRNINKTIYDMLQKQLEEKMLPYRIRKNVKVEECSYTRNSIFSERHNTAAEDYKNLAAYIGGIENG